MSEVPPPVPYVFETKRPRTPIGFDRKPDLNIEVVQHVPAQELREWHQQIKDRREGRL